MLETLKKNPVYSLFFPIAAVFVWVNFVSTQEGGHNAMARMITLHAIAEKHTFQIDDYLKYTIDWAKSKHDGHYYANKAPGVTMLAIPVYLLVRPIAMKLKHFRVQEGDQNIPGYFEKTILSFLMQVFPFIFLGFWFWRSVPADWNSQLYFLLSFFFGSTAAIVMNTFFGHGLAAILLLAALWFTFQKKYIWVGLFWGLAILSEYSAVALFPLGMLLIYLQEKKSFKWIVPIVCGGFLPGVLWIWFHTTFFGSPFSTPLSSSPTFQASSSSVNVGGVIGLLPKFSILMELLIGGARGLLFTQPWIPALISFLLVRWKELSLTARRWAIFAIPGFFILLYMNASFEGWHGGGSPGPRYMAIIFPVFSLLALLSYTAFSKPQRATLWILLSYTLVFRIVVATGDILAPYDESLWHYFWAGITTLRRGSEVYKLIAMLIPSLMAAYVVWKFGRKQVAHG